MAPFISEIPIILTTIETRNLPLLSALQNPSRVRALVEKPIIGRHPNYNLVHLRVYFGKLVSTFSSPRSILLASSFPLSPSAHPLPSVIHPPLANPKQLSKLARPQAVGSSLKFPANVKPRLLIPGARYDPG